MWLHGGWMGLEAAPLEGGTGSQDAADVALI